MTEEQRKKDAKFWAALWDGWIEFNEPVASDEYWDDMFHYFAELNTDKEKGRAIQAILDILDERGKANGAVCKIQRPDSLKRV